MNSISQIVKERSFFHYTNRSDRYAKQAFVMDVFARLQRERKFECLSNEINLTEIWDQVKMVFSEWEKPATITKEVTTQPNLSNYYNNQPSGIYTGD